MVIITAADHRFRRHILLSRWYSNLLDYDLRIFDLGGLGIGDAYNTNNYLFQKTGFYGEHDGGWKIKSSHKPHLILKELKHFDFITYLDADAVVVKPIDEVVGEYDIGLTIRRHNEQGLLNAHRRYVGQINAGVMFFRNTKRTIGFVEEWAKRTDWNKCDQVVLNDMLGEINLVRGQVVCFQGLNIKCFSTDMYNFYYFPEDYSQAKVLHFKSGCRGNFNNFVASSLL